MYSEGGVLEFARFPRLGRFGLDLACNTNTKKHSSPYSVVSGMGRVSL
jgi:hypothetical protein